MALQRPGKNLNPELETLIKLKRIFPGLSDSLARKA